MLKEAKCVLWQQFISSYGEQHSVKIANENMLSKIMCQEMLIAQLSFLMWFYVQIFL